MPQLLILLLLLLISTPIVLIIAGLIKLLNPTKAIKERGKSLLLIGIVLLGIELLIGYSVCSNGFG